MTPLVGFLVSAALSGAVVGLVGRALGQVVRR